MRILKPLTITLFSFSIISPAFAQQAEVIGEIFSGGEVYTYAEGETEYRVHIFSPVEVGQPYESFTVDDSEGVKRLDYLLVGGGGAGGKSVEENRGGGGGGGGQVVKGSLTDVPRSNFNLKVGHGFDEADGRQQNDNFKSKTELYGLANRKIFEARGGGDGGDGTSLTDDWKGVQGPNPGGAGQGGDFNGPPRSGFRGGAKGGYAYGDLLNGGSGGGGAGAGENHLVVGYADGGSPNIYGDGNVYGGYGGVGFYSEITGEGKYYAGGGGGGTCAPHIRWQWAHPSAQDPQGISIPGVLGGSQTFDAQDGADGTGDGGGGACGLGRRAGSGGDGVIIIRYEVIAPTVEIEPIPVIVSEPFTVTFQFSEPVKITDAEYPAALFDTADDIELTNATASQLEPIDSFIFYKDDEEYAEKFTALITPLAPGEVTVKLSAGTAKDEVNNRNKASNVVTTTFENSAPTITLGELIPTSGGFISEINLSEASTNFEANDLIVTNGAAELTGSGMNYIAMITPDANGEVRLEVPAVQFTDSAGNPNVSSNEVTAIYDGSDPTVEISGVPEVTNSAFEITIKFSKDVKNFEYGDIQAINAYVAEFKQVNLSTYTALIIPKEQGSITIKIDEAVAIDAWGNQNIAAADATTVYDGEITELGEPIVLNSRVIENGAVEIIGIARAGTMITALWPDVSQTEVETNTNNNFVIISNDGIVDYVLGNEAVQNTNTPDGLTFTVELSAIEDDHEVNIPVDVKIEMNSALVPSAGPDQEVASGDIVTLDGSGSSNSDGDVVSYSWRQVSGTAVTLSSATDQKPSFTAPTLKAADDDMVLEFALIVADDQGLHSFADHVVITVKAPIALQSAKEIGEAIANFQFERANQTLRNQGSLMHRFNREGEGFVSIDITNNLGVAAFKTGNKRPTWFELSASRSESDGQAHTTGFLVAGVDKKINDNLLLGLMLQGDHNEAASVTESITGTGYFIGPYFVAKHPDHELFIEGRALYGQTFNEYDPVGGSSDDFKTERFLATLKVQGSIEAGSGLMWSPYLSGGFTRDTKLAHTNFEGFVIPEQSVSIAQASFGLDFRKQLENLDNTFAFTGGISGSYNKTEGTGYAKDVVPAFEGASARIKLGVENTTSNGQTINLGIDYDGIGQDDYSTMGLTFGYNYEF